MKQWLLREIVKFFDQFSDWCYWWQTFQCALFLGWLSNALISLSVLTFQIECSSLHWTDDRRPNSFSRPLQKPPDKRTQNKRNQFKSPTECTLLHGPRQLIVDSNEKPDKAGLQLTWNLNKNSNVVQNASTTHKPKLLKDFKTLKPLRFELIIPRRWSQFLLE